LTTPSKRDGKSASHGNLEARDLRDDIARTRAEMSGTLDELHGKLNPTILKEQALEQFHELKDTITAELKDAKDSMKAEVKAELAEAKAAVREATIGKVQKMAHDVQNTAMDTGSSIVDTIKQNPIPAALAGVGLAWLFMSATKNRGPRRFRTTYDGDIRVREPYGEDTMNPFGDAIHRVGEKASGIAQGIQAKADNMAHQAEDLAHSVQNKAGEALHNAGDYAHRAQESLGAATHAVGDKVTGIAHVARDRAVRLESDAERFYGENPLMVGVAMVAAGAALGMAIPITRREEQWMGGVRDQVMGKVNEFAKGALEQVGGVAQRATDDLAKVATDKMSGTSSSKPNETDKASSPKMQDNKIGEYESGSFRKPPTNAGSFKPTEFATNTNTSTTSGYDKRPEDNEANGARTGEGATTTPKRTPPSFGHG